MAFPDFIQKYWMVFLSVVVWFTLRGEIGSVEFDNSDVTVVLFLVFFFGFKLFQEACRYQTSQLVTERHHFSNCDRGYQVGPWYIMSGGDIKVPYYHETGQESTVVVPFKLLKSYGSNLVARVRTKQITFIQLPREVRNCIKTHGLNQKNIIFGVASSVYEFDHPDVVNKILKMEDQNTLISNMEDIISKDTKALEESAYTYKRIQERFDRPQSIKERIFGPEPPKQQQEPPLR